MVAEGGERIGNAGDSGWWTWRVALWLFAALGAAFYLGKFWYLLLTNVNYPWSLVSSSTLATLLISFLSLICGGVCAQVSFTAWRTSEIGFLSASVITILVAWTLYPVACDSHESWVDEPNKVCDCSGLTLNYYPKGTMDYSEIEYCIGLER
jgi:hypothetical protein